MKTLPRSISLRHIALLLTAYSASMFMTGLSGTAFAQEKIVFKSLADFDKCAANNSYDTGVCMEALQKYAKAHPKELFAIGKRARLQFKHWAALQFFEPGLGASPAATQCADEDVSLAIVSGLSMPVDATPNAIARRLLSGKCFPSVRTAVEKEIASANGEGYLLQHACPVFAKKGIKLSGCEPKKEVAAAPVMEEKLPMVDIASAKVGIIKVYSGSEGERMTMADVPGTPGAYLVRIDGVRSPINGKTMVHKEQKSGNGFNYWTEVDGKQWNTIIMRGGSYKNYTVYVPGLRDAIGMSYNERESKAASADSFKK
ncbi:hypothetical protein [Chamaesiphon sp. VAR_48_metabat_135_sub]|uniref:hypothetical protein n=1 Tax=Chamaesiphon sp. VAR_48_metabat_135_sub TaxID=2964699 RepID=UPI00286C66ED|nr:hypothetical protein [Chamaesiphon sp. VAR_48_metabat_135_sub]